MTCSDVHNLLSTYLDGELSAELRASVSRHLTECPNCADECRIFEKTIRLIKKFECLPLPRDYTGKLP